MATASAKSGVSGCPYFQLEVTAGSSTGSTQTYNWKTSYVSSSAISCSSNWEPEVIATIDGDEVSTTSIKVNGVKTTRELDSGSFTVDKTHYKQEIDFSIYVNWNYQISFSGTSLGEYEGSSSVTCAALNSYTVSYNANGGSGAPSSQTKWYGESMQISSTIPVKTGYTFLGWSTSSTGSVQYSAGGYYESNNAATLYAIWEVTKYTITYNDNGGYGGPGSQIKYHGTNLTLSNTKPVKDNVSGGSYTVTFNANGGSCDTTSLTTQRFTKYTFNRWSTNSSGTGTTYNPGATYSTDESLTLYAIYSSSTSANSITLPVATKSGYDFLGWSTNATDTSGVNGNYTPSGNVTLYAIFGAKGMVHISNGTTYSSYLVYIHNGSTWDQYIPYVHDGSKWVICS